MLYHAFIWDAETGMVDLNDLIASSGWWLTVATADPTHARAPLDVVLSGDGSYDPDGDSISCVWDFGEGTSNAGISVSHGRAAVGSYLVALTVSDGSRTTSASIEIKVRKARRRRR